MNKREQRLLKIYEVALKIFARYGYRRTRMEDIADELGVTKGNLYLYARNKRDLYEQTVAHALLQWQASARQAMEQHGDALDMFAAYALHGFQYLSQHEELRMLIMEDPGIFPPYPTEDPFFEINYRSINILKDVLHKGIADKKFREMDVDHVAELLYSVYMMFVIKTYVKSETSSSEKMFEEGIQLLMDGMLLK